MNLTKYEKYILLFLIFVALLGTGLLHYKKISNRVLFEVDNTDFLNVSKFKTAKPININTATTEELASLKGIGPALASRIIEYRRVHGYFSKKEELKKVSGIGPAKFKDIHQMIKTE